MKLFKLSALAVASMMMASPLALAKPTLGKELASVLPTLSGADTLMAVLTYDQLEPVSEAQVQKLLSLGITQGVQFKSVPVVGVMVNAAQIQALSEDDDLRSIWLNRKLEYFTADARQITGVDAVQGTEFAARNGQEFTGKGVTIMVNDSGVDATHQDLFFGQQVIENVQAITHASALEITGVTEGFVLTGQPNTDTNSGHGTHCAGIIAGTGVMSDGKYVGAAPDAKLVGYGSGGGLFILDAVGGYDYAINHVYSFDDPIRVISNSWGSSGKFDPAGPVALASYKAHKLGILSVFASGNSGPGEDTHNPYAQIPWGIAVGAGDKDGKLAGFSSRGLKGEEGTFTMPDQTTWTYSNDVTIVAPGVDIIATRASTNLSANGGEADVEAIEPEYLPFYTMISGTSMATPHVSGIVAMMLEANPALDNLSIKRLLMETATNMPGYERWEVGAGYVNARAAVAAALNYDPEHRITVNNLADKTFNANALLLPSERSEELEVFYSPVGEPEVKTFVVDDQAAWVKASANTATNLTKLVLVDPDGVEYFGNLSTPVLEESMRVSAPAKPGNWGVYVYGLTSLSGVQADPLGLTNGPGLPEFFDVLVQFENSGGYQGLDDIAGHPLQTAVEFAISERLMDGFNNSVFRPDALLRRKDLANYLVMGGAVRQYRDLLEEPAPMLSQVPSSAKAFVESVSVKGAAIKDRLREQDPLMQSAQGNFNPNGTVSKLDMAYTLVQLLGMQAQARAFNSDDDIVVDYRGQTVVLSDQHLIPASMKGYVQTAINLSLINVQFAVQQGAFDLEPTLEAYFQPDVKLTRAAYALTASRFYEAYLR
ncbi:S8 family serine peptidase [Aliiglaciecola sp. CAU 1673]|uniref:S8 family peptidase n=1 Tax=Aliiglaciecola sp. CAU 1673 TaxID=3032595 RepID=UPI0023DC48B5|nr:S8 family serine peptidase [Aliiglaciecola sp. CAU 1673]MDF2178155.1 S8 family serine peptidase [Aliiglaciecola sp. CAU 1673]